MTRPTRAHPDTQTADSELPPRVAAFLAAYEAGPGAITAQQETGLVDLAPAVERMDVVDDPFVHGTIDTFLPGELHEAVLRHWPEESALAAVTLPSDGGPSADYLGSRKTKLLEQWGDGAADGASAETWNHVSLALRAPAFVRRLFTRFAAVVEDHLAQQNLDAATAGRPGFKLYANFDHGAKEALGAHVDALRKILTIVVYLDLTGDTTGESPHRWGTALYEAQPGAVKPVRFSPNAERPVARQIEFAANRAFVMPNTSRALHGVAGGQAGVARRTLMCGYWLLSK